MTTFWLSFTDPEATADKRFLGVAIFDMDESAGIVAMSRKDGVYAYPIDGGQIGAMAKEGFLRRDGNLVWVDRTCRTGAGALNDEFENLKAALFGSAV